MLELRMSPLCLFTKMPLLEASIGWSNQTNPNKNITSNTNLCAQTIKSRTFEKITKWEVRSTNSQSNQSSNVNLTTQLDLFLFILLSKLRLQSLDKIIWFNQVSQKNLVFNYHTTPHLQEWIKDIVQILPRAKTFHMSHSETARFDRPETMNKNILKIDHLNTKSLNNKIDELKNYLAVNKIAIINETWLSHDSKIRFNKNKKSSDHRNRPSNISNSLSYPIG